MGNEARRTKKKKKKKKSCENTKEGKIRMDAMEWKDRKQQTVAVLRWPTPTISTSLNHSGPSDCLVVSLISGLGYFPFLYGHTKHNIHTWEGGRKENKQTRTWVSSKRKKGEVCDTFVQLSVHLQVIASVCIRAKFPQSHQECWLIFSR